MFMPEEDPLAAAKGVIIGSLFGGIAWGIILWAVFGR